MSEQAAWNEGIVELAREFHDRYEVEARRLGWATQDSTRVEFDDLPEANKQTMLCTIAPFWERLSNLESALAARDVALNQHGHVLHLNEEGWSIEHPVECRKIGLTNCDEHNYIACEIDVLKESYGLGDFAITYRSEGDMEWLDIKNLNDEASDHDPH